MLFAFQMGDPSARPIAPHEFDLPTSNEKAADDPASLFPLKPVKSAGGDWSYEMPDGVRLSATEVVKAVRVQKRTPILLVPKTASVQSYLDAEQPLRKQGLKVGLAVTLDGETKQ